MKAKFLMFLLVLGTCLTFSNSLFAQTDEDFDFGGKGDDVAIPVALAPVIIEGTLFHEAKSVEIRFLEELGNIEVQIVDESGKSYVRTHVNSNTTATIKIDLKDLAAKTYTIWCINRETGLAQLAQITLHK